MTRTPDKREQMPDVLYCESEHIENRKYYIGTVKKIEDTDEPYIRLSSVNVPDGLEEALDIGVQDCDIDKLFPFEEKYGLHPSEIIEQAARELLQIKGEKC